MDVSKIENGTWKTVETHFPNVGGLKIEVISYDESGRMGRKICNVVTRDYDYKESHAELIAEAGTITNQCGFSPKELLEQRDELLKALNKCANVLAGYNSERSVNAYLIANQAIQKIKGNER